MNAECNNEAIIGKNNPMVVGRIHLMSLTLKKSIILIFEMTSDFNIHDK